MFVEFAGSAGVGKTTIAEAALHVLSERVDGVDALPSVEPDRLATWMHLAQNPHLLGQIRNLRALHPDRGRPIARNWARQVVAADVSRRLSRRGSTIVVSQEVLFHWLKKFPASTQARLADAGLPLPDLLVLLVTTPAERFRRSISRRRYIDGIDRIAEGDIERMARSTASRLLRSFPIEDCTRTLLDWGSNQAANRLSPQRLRSILAEEARDSGPIDPRRHELENKDWIHASAARLGIPLVRVENLSANAPVDVATEATEKILAHWTAHRSARSLR